MPSISPPWLCPPASFFSRISDGLGGEHQARDRSRVLQGSTRHLDLIDGTGLDQVLIGTGTGVVAEARTLCIVHRNQ